MPIVFRKKVTFIVDTRVHSRDRIVKRDKPAQRPLHIAINGVTQGIKKVTRASRMRNG